MLSKRKIKLRAKKKTSPVLEETIKLALANESWNPIAKILSGSTRNQLSVNLGRIDREAKEGDTLLITGKVLSKGFLTKKVKIIALSISPKALTALKQSKSEFVNIKDEIKKNPKAEGIKVLK
jgi:large subunit ribosomal protein L18e